MAVTVECPSCRRRLQVLPQSIGMDVACPSCRQIFRVEINQRHLPAPGPSAPPGAVAATEPSSASIPDPFAPPEPGIGSIDDWRKVRAGITLIWAGTLIGVVLVIFALCAGLFAGISIAASGGDPDSAMAAVLLFVVVFMFAALLNRVLECVGQIFCLWAAAEHGARRWAIACLVLFVAGFGLQLLGGVVSLVELGAPSRIAAPGLPETAGTIGAAASNVGQILDLVNVIVFLFFLRAVARCIEDAKLQDNVRQLLSLATAAVVLTIGVLAVLFVASARDDTALVRNMGIFGFGAGCTVLVLLLAAFIWYIVLLWQVRAALAWHIRRRGGD